MADRVSRTARLASAARAGGPLDLLGGGRFFRARAAEVERQLRQIRAGGTEQFVLLGAGLDAHAGAALKGARVFEVDRPTTLAHKAAVGLATYQPWDLERAGWADALGERGLAADQPCCVLLEGVAMYLSTTAIEQLAGEFAGLASGSLLLVTTPADRLARWAMGLVAGALGERFANDLSPAELCSLLTRAGLVDVASARVADAGPLPVAEVLVTAHVP